MIKYKENMQEEISDIGREERNRQTQRRKLIRREAREEIFN